MRFRRIVFFSLLPVMLLLGLYTGYRPFYAVLFTQMLLLIIVLAIDIYTVKTFSYKQEIDVNHGVKGSETVLRLEIINEKVLPMSLLNIQIQGTCTADDTDISLSLAPGARHSFEIPVHMPYRGVYPIGMTALCLTDMFGLLDYRFDMRKLPYYRQPKLTVYPKGEMPTEMQAALDDEKLFANSMFKYFQSGESPASAREFRPGDPLKSVNWKKSVQHGKLYVKQYDYPLRESVLIIIDNSYLGYTGEKALAYADTICEIASGLGLYSLNNCCPVKIIASSGQTAARKYVQAAFSSDFSKVNRWLAELQFVNTDRISDLTDAINTANEEHSVFVLTGKSDAQFSAAMLEADRRCKSAVLISVGNVAPAPEGLNNIRIPVGAGTDAIY